MISYIIPAKNEEKYIIECIRSLFSQEGITDSEVIVVDNNCSDNTGEIVKQAFPQVRVVSESRAGISYARQKGFESSIGEILVFVDADCRLPKQWTKLVIEKLQLPQVVAVSGPYKFYDTSTWNRYVLDFFQYLMYLWSKLANFFGEHNTVLIAGDVAIKREALVRIGGFDTRHIFQREDVDTARKLQKFGKVIFEYDLWALSSARRLNKVGLFKMIGIYIYHHIAGMFSHKPAKKGYETVR